MTDENTVGLDSILGGQVLDRFQYELMRVMENINDPNTVLTKRSLTIKLDIKPSKSRAQSDVVISFATKLAPTEALETTVYSSMTRKGLVLSEYHPQQPVLPEMVDNVASLRTINGGVK